MARKTVKFRNKLIDSILKGKKTETWRLFDDKNLSVGDERSFVKWETGEGFAREVIDTVSLSTLGEMYQNDPDTHETYENAEAMVKEFRECYGADIDVDTEVTVIRFQITS